MHPYIPFTFIIYCKCECSWQSMAGPYFYGLSTFYSQVYKKRDNYNTSIFSLLKGQLTQIMNIFFFFEVVLVCFKMFVPATI